MRLDRTWQTVRRVLTRFALTLRRKGLSMQRYILPPLSNSGRAFLAPPTRPALTSSRVASPMSASQPSCPSLRPVSTGVQQHTWRGETGGPRDVDGRTGVVRCGPFSATLPSLTGRLHVASLPSPIECPCWTKMAFEVWSVERDVLCKRTLTLAVHAVSRRASETRQGGTTKHVSWGLLEGVLPDATLY
ncbi:hypothetical protein BDY21DRAFT_10419 [Lineolata rhizophorae]|uniref:Uncharacterized protein n=1 Tax=Lineolata rhizophorae TaxID=578093 RepID=A0A6A6PE38_9PEZI|nr:hypothetical protein BDY21DRAFT_10419 [Lineolata rhizophorae]